MYMYVVFAHHNIIKVNLSSIVTIFIFLTAFFQTAIIIAKLASWGKVSLSESDLNYFLSWVKNGLASAVSASSIHAVHVASYFNDKEVLFSTCILSTRQLFFVLPRHESISLAFVICLLLIASTCGFVLQ